VSFFLRVLMYAAEVKPTKNKIMLKKIIFIFTVLVLFSSFTKKDDGTFTNKYVGLPLADTPFGEYVEGEPAGDYMIVFVWYGCSHCWEATNAVRKLKDAGLINNMLIIGTGDTNEKEEFKQNTAADYTMVDYATHTGNGRITEIDAVFPPAPYALWVHDKMLKKVFVKVPDVKRFKHLSHLSP